MKHQDLLKYSSGNRFSCFLSAGNQPDLPSVGSGPSVSSVPKPGTCGVACMVVPFATFMLLWVCSAILQLGVNLGLGVYMGLGGPFLSTLLWFPKASFLTPLARKIGFSWSCHHHHYCSHREMKRKKEDITGISSILCTTGTYFSNSSTQKDGFYLGFQMFMLLWQLGDWP